MIDSNQVITAFVLYERENLVAQGGFQVRSELEKNIFYLLDGQELRFDHSYLNTTCNVTVSLGLNGVNRDRFELNIPINRTKEKWKHYSFGGDYKLLYRCQID